MSTPADLSPDQDLDLDLDLDLEQPPRHSGLMEKLPILLRLLGAAAVVIAMYSFLARGWQSGNDMLRYLLMLGHTVALTAIGLASGHWLKEGKGARLLLALALVSVPVNFAILGAFIYSQTGAMDIGDYPSYVAWSVDSLQSAYLTSGGALLILVPVTLLGFTALARSMSKKLSLLFLLSNAVLLLPLRDPYQIGLLVLALTGCTLYLSRKMAGNHIAAKTMEGVTALGLQLLPLGVMAGRSLWLYDANMFLVSSASITLFLIMRQVSLFLEQESKPRHLMDILSLFPTLSTAYGLSTALYGMDSLPNALILPTTALATTTMIYAIGQRNSAFAFYYRTIAVAGLLLTQLANLLFFADLPAALASLIVGLLLVLRGFSARQLTLFGSGIVLMLASIIEQLYQLVHHFDLENWAGLALLGTAAIVIASLIESRGGVLKPHFEAWRESAREWER